ncbi:MULTISPECIES: polysaccharide deacetylase family protein [Marinobacter]|uniref:polysaccharide deacetylase family protein n=1 Tax=Marinobacter TaxID=2742 RepID=UPI001CD94201|nr:MULTISPECIES: polysaccharide deacetylase family protein [Marinobacter]
MDELWKCLDKRQPIPSRSVMFTIDDGFYDHHDVAARVFDEFGFPLNFFVITGLLDQQLWPWDDQVSYALNHSRSEPTDIRLPSGTVYSVNLEVNSAKATVKEIREALKAGPQTEIYQWLREELFGKLGVDFPSSTPPEYRPMSWSDAKSLRERGHGVYPHTRTHRILSTLNPAEKREEIVGSLKRVEEELGYTPQVFAYPTGRPADYDSGDVNELGQAGFNMAFNTVPAYVRQGQDRYQLPRFSLPENTADFVQIVNRFEALKEKLRS